MNRTLRRLLPLLVPVLLGGNVQAATPRSGYDFLKPETREIQNDDFQNPGMLTVEAGRQRFNARPQAAGARSCADCHGADGEKLGAAAIARYPVVRAGKVVTLGQQIDACVERAGAPDTYPTHDRVALETFVRNRARGTPVNVQTGGAAAPLLARGKQLFETRYGLIDISCAQCHELYPGQMLRGQRISAGMANGFPAYRLDTGEITTLEQRIRQCLTLMRAEPFRAGSRENHLLELYLMARSNGLKIETPAVRY